MNKKNKGTLGVRYQPYKTNYHEHSVPIFATSSFVFDDSENARALFAEELVGNIYTRFSNPNNDEFAGKLAAMEGVEDGVPTSSGMSAIFLSIMAFLKSGDHLIASRSLFGSTHQLFSAILPRWGISHTYVEVDQADKWEQHIQPNTKALFIETPSNPGLDIIDMQKAGELAKVHNLIFIVDNTFATPIIQNPAEFGAHIIVHSATKYIDGQGRTIGGAVVGNRELMQEVRFLARQTGPSLSPFNGWVLSKSLETLQLRMQRHSENARALADILEKNPDVAWVKYPFLKSFKYHDLAMKQMQMGGGIVTFELKGGKAQGIRFIDALQMLSITANLGDTRTIVTHPATTTHSKLSVEDREKVGITEGLIRMAVGLEDIADILDDVEQAIEKSC
jgi:O-succinylhomoserine sulfhydrylase